MNQYPTIDRWYAITTLCLNVVFLVVTIFAARRAAKTEADAPEVLRKHHRVVLWAGMAGFTLIATVPAVLTWAGFLPSVGTMGVSIWVLIAFNFFLGWWARKRELQMRAQEKK